MLKKIKPEFKDDIDKLIILGMFLLSFLPVLFIPALIVIFLLKEKISEQSYLIAKAYFNLELLIFIASLIFVLPVVGELLRTYLWPIIYVFNVVIIIINICAIAKSSETKIPVPFEFL